MYAILVDDVAYVFNGSACEGTFLEFGVQFMITEAFKDVAKVLYVGGKVRAEYENIIEVYNDEFTLVGLKYTVH